MLSVWGLIGAALMLATGLIRMFDPSLIYGALPIILYEMVQAVWLIVKGFNSSAIAAASYQGHALLYPALDPDLHVISLGMQHPGGKNLRDPGQLNQFREEG